MTLNDISTYQELRGARVLVRGSLNVPLEDGTPGNTLRLQRMLPTLTLLKQRGARTILVGHIGRAKDATLRPVCEELTTHIPVQWAGDVCDPGFADAVEAMHDGDIVMAENLRQHEEEKANDPAFAKHLASFADLYVNEAFDNVHREHASMVGVPALVPAWAGCNCLREVAELEGMMQPSSPSLFMIGGAKFETKLPLIKRYLDIYDQVFVGGALANDVLKARGYEVGQSLVSSVSFDTGFVDRENLLAPVDVVVEREGVATTCLVEDVQPQDAIKDIGPATVELLKGRIEAAGAILWNGPFGQFERGYYEQTEQIAKFVASSKAYTVVGGGDTTAAIEHLSLYDAFDFLSTGGGAMLTFLEHGTTPALELLRADR